MDLSLIQKATEILKTSGIVAIPTETVYGLAANALDAAAVRRIFEAKGRPFIDPLIVHIYDFEMLSEIAEPNDFNLELANEFWPGPFTLIFKKKPCVPDIVTAGKSTIAVRMPAHPVVRELLKTARIPLAAPSANPFGYVSPTCAEHVRDQLGDKIDMILDGGPCSCGVESTIVLPPCLSDDGRAYILRQGPVSAEDVERVAKLKTFLPVKNPAHPMAPGMLPSHYSPRAKLRLFDYSSGIPADFIGRRIFFKRPVSPSKNDYWMTENGDLREAARNIFGLLRALDKNSEAPIYCQRAPDRDIGRAINDRLERASCKL